MCIGIGAYMYITKEMLCVTGSAIVSNSKSFL